MTFNVYKPSKQLEPSIVCYLEADSRTIDTKKIHTLFPNGYSGVFFNFGYTGKILIKEEYQTPQVSIFGQIDQCFEAIHWPGSYSLGALMHPTALSKLIHEDMSAFTNKAFDGTLIHVKLKSLHAAMEEAKDAFAKIALLNNFFASVFSKISVTTITDYAVKILQQSGFQNIRKVSDELGISERHLEVQFKKHVGISPKTYALINRFKRMEQLLHHKTAIKWEQMNFSHEYYDQSHFIKDFKRFTGHTPSHYLLQNFEMGRSYLRQ